MVAKMEKNIGQRLEEYTIKRPQELLIVTVEISGQMDQIAIFKGFSSSLMRATAADPDIPVLPANAKIITIDRLLSPYNPDFPVYLEQGLTSQTIEPLLQQLTI